ncbi:MAG: hypothetical protein H0T11_00470, partial [Chthoniobacterales bacterium]|nr:hypothetical protein [Chthoniobacterales bacterium]
MSKSLHHLSLLMCAILLIVSAARAGEPADHLERAKAMRARVSSLLDQINSAADGWPESLPDAGPLIYLRPEHLPDPSDEQNLAPSVAVLHEQFSDHPEGVWVAFADGHLEFARSQETLDICLGQLAVGEPAWEKSKAERVALKALATSQPAAVGTLR